MGSFVELCLFNHWCMAGLTFSCQNVFPNIPEKTSHSLHVHLSYRGKYRAMYFKSLCPELPFDFPKRGRILFLPSIAVDICRLSLVIKESERQEEKTGMNSFKP
jgi:hypothetical protein